MKPAGGVRRTASRRGAPQHFAVNPPAHGVELVGGGRLDPDQALTPGVAAVYKFEARRAIERDAGQEIRSRRTPRPPSNRGALRERAKA
jgi:hypothetical protein